MEPQTISFKALMAILRKASAIRFTRNPQERHNVVIHSTYSCGEDGFSFDFLDSEYFFSEHEDTPLSVVDKVIHVKSLDGLDFYITPLFSLTLDELLTEANQV